MNCTLFPSLIAALSQPARCQIDYGATVNILPKCYINNHYMRIEIVTLRMWNSIKMDALVGKVKATYVIVDQDGFTPQLSRKAFNVMKQITVNYDHFEMIHLSISHLFRLCLSMSRNILRYLMDI